MEKSKGIEETTFIYGLCDPRTGELRYVGKSNRPSERVTEHLRESSKTIRGRTYCHRWVKGLIADGLRPEWFVLEQVPVNEWQEAERFWIQYFRSIGCRLTNEAPGGEGLLFVTDEVKAKMKDGWRKKDQSEKLELYKRRSERMLKNPPCVSEYVAISPEGKEIRFFNMAKFCREQGLSRIAMSNVVSGRNGCGQHRGWRVWRFGEPLLKREKKTRKDAKRWVVVSPDGERMEVINMVRFCHEKGLTRSAMTDVANGRYSRHRGWKVEKVE